MPGVTVTFSGAGLKFSSTTATTGSKGEAEVTATAITIGSLTATASVGGSIKPVTFFGAGSHRGLYLLTVTATSNSVLYGKPIPLTYTITGFVNGDTSKVVSGSPVETTTAKDGSAPGTYPITITAGSLTAANYAFKFVDGTLTITPLGTVIEPSGSQTVSHCRGNQRGDRLLHDGWDNADDLVDEIHRTDYGDEDDHAKVHCCEDGVHSLAGENGGHHARVVYGGKGPMSFS